MSRVFSAKKPVLQRDKILAEITENSVYTEFFTDNFPARAVLEVSRIPADGLVEIMMVAIKSE